MINADVLIITAPKQTGKTTFLQKWIAGREDVAGVLTPIVNGKRNFFNINTGEFFIMEAAEAEANILHVGKYFFSATAFVKANEILERHHQHISFLIIDEIGPLEIKQQKGFYQSLQKLLLQPKLSYQLILVVRENLIAEVLALLEGYKKSAFVIDMLPVIKGEKKFF